VQHDQPAATPQHESFTHHPIYATLEEAGHLREVADGGESPATPAIIAGVVSRSSSRSRRSSFCWRSSRISPDAAPLDCPHVAQEAVSFERDIRPLFRERDVNSMSFAFDLSSYEDVRGSAEQIYRRLSDGSMPCDGNWPSEHVQRFRTWIDTGCPP
jgi:hypothetical protein